MQKPVIQGGRSLPRQLERKTPAYVVALPAQSSHQYPEPYATFRNGATMALEICLATTADAGRIAEIHMAAFGANELLVAQFPTPEVRRSLRLCIEQKALADIKEPKVTVLVAETAEPYETVAFAKWSHPVQAGENYAETPWVCPEGTDLAVLGAWTAMMEDAEGDILGSTPCYRELPLLT